MSKVIGFDPGTKGGITVLENGEIIDCFAMPVFEIDTGKKSKKLKKPIFEKYVDTKEILLRLKDHCDAELFIENLHSVFNSSASSNFKMGGNFWTIKSCCRAMGVINHLVHGKSAEKPYYKFRPKQWQDFVWIESDKVYYEENGKEKVDTKKTSLNAAKRIFPGHSFLLDSRKRTPHDGMYDSALIAKAGELWIKETYH